MSAQSFAINPDDMSLAISFSGTVDEPQTRKNPILKIRSLVNNDKLGYYKDEDGNYHTVMCVW